MKKHILILVIFIFTSLIAQSNSDKKKLEREFEIRYGGEKKSRSMDESIVKEQYNNSIKYVKKSFKKYRNFPLPPLPPIEESENDNPSPPSIPGEVVKDDPKKDDSKLRDSLLSDYEGLYTVAQVYGKTKYVKFSEPIAFRYKGKILKLISESSYSSHASFNEEGRLISNNSHLVEPVKVKVGNNEVEISGWSGFNSEGNITFLCPAGDNLKFKIGENEVLYKSVGPSGYLQKIFFYGNGNVRSIHIKEPQTLKVANRSIKFDHHEGCGGDLDFYESGNLQGGYLADKTKIEGIELPKASFVKFSENGKLIAINFPGQLTIKGYSVSTNDEYWPLVEFYENGNLKKIKALAKDTNIEGKLYNKGKEIYFKEDGKFYYSN